MRSLKWAAYGAVRPLVRPIMHRLRSFFSGDLHDEVRRLRAEVATLKTLIECQHPQSIEMMVDQRTRQIMGQTLVTLALDRDQASEDLPFST